eukprot:Selendium_serpulae@DN6201_c0_g1_i1.p1
MKLSRVAILLGLTALVGHEGFSAKAQDFDDDDDDFGDDEGFDEDYEDMKKEMSFGGGAPAAAAGKGGSMSSVPFKAPRTDGIHWVETFEDGWESRWSRSAAEKFTGNWEQVLRKDEAISGDHALCVMDEAKHHGIAARFPAIPNNEDGTFIVSYEAKFETGLQCGGAYLKLVDGSDLSDMSEFNNETPYVIMFGPDRCGSTNKVHFIFKLKNPISGEWTEHHMNSPPMVPGQDVTHLYTLIIKPDDTFIVEIDGVEARSGSLFEEMSPALQTPEDIPDPDDEKPDDWVDEPKIADPDSEKPDDWDEDAPEEIEDTDAEKPDDWLENEPKLIPDPHASTPDDWDDEEDGEWQAPLIANPRCAEVKGCGPWHPPLLRNPEYKGKWKAPMVDNPEYKGPWKRRTMANPAYYKLEKPHRMYPMSAVGFELWTMQGNLLFDNIVISRNVEALRRFTDATFKIRHEIEMSNTVENKADIVGDMSFLAKMQNMTRWYITEYPVPAGAAVVISLLLTCMLTMRRGKSEKSKADQDTKEKSESEKEKSSATATTGGSEQQSTTRQRKKAEKD